jgi:hypothetical protein
MVALLCALTLYVTIACRIGLGIYDGGPDEVMRALLPQCMIQGNWLPSGYDSCAIYNIGNWSYAFYPQLAGAYTSAGFMSFAKLLGLSNSAVFVSGRFASVLFSVIALIFTAKSVHFIFRKHQNRELLTTISILLLGFWPQYTFISSYMNNDIVAFAGVSVMLYASIVGISEKWHIRTCLILAFGIALTSLGYWNAYGFILISILVFLITVVRQNTANIKRTFTLISAAALPSAVLVMPFFIVNIFRYGDLIGTTAFHKQYQAWIDQGNTPVQHPWTGSLRALLFDSDYILTTFQSFIGNLGYMTIPLPFTACLIYICIIFTGLGLFISSYHIYAKKPYIKLFCISVVIAAAFTLLVSLYYTLATDYQPQGRYVIYILAPIILMIMVGIGNTILTDTASTIRKAAVISMFVLYAAFCIYFFIHTIHYYGWSGVNLS